MVSLLRDQSGNAATESTPLLADSRNDVDTEHHAERPVNGHREPIDTAATKKTNWPTYTALGLLTLAGILILVFGFIVPDAVEKYAVQAATIDLEELVPELTATGARARIKGTFAMRSSNVQNEKIRHIGMFGTWIARQVETDETTVGVTLPEYGNALLGTAVIPGLKVSVVDGRATKIDVTASLLPPKKLDGVRTLVDEWLNNSLDHVNVAGHAMVSLRSGIFRLPSQRITQSILIHGNRIPEMPRFNITRLIVSEGRRTGPAKGMEANATVEIQNDYPLDLAVPPLDFDMLVGNCLPDEPKIMLADVSIRNTHILPRQPILLNATGFIRELPDRFTNECPSSGKSPLDTLLGGYIKGHDITFYIRGSQRQSPETPKWISDIISSVTVPVPVPGQTLGDVIRNFTLADVDFTLPDPLAEPNSPQSNPRVSATIQAWVTLPQEVNFNTDVQRVRALADVTYKNKKMGELNIRQWQAATSNTGGKDENGRPLLLIESDIKKAPLEITDDDLFADLVQAMLFSSKPVILGVKAFVDVEINTTLGVLTVRDIPAEGSVPVDTFSDGSTGSLKPKIHGLSVVETTRDTLSLRAMVDVNNPTNYSAHIPYLDVNLFSNSTIIAHGTIQGVDLKAGSNQNITVFGIWQPSIADGRRGAAVGREVLSRYISGYNLTLGVRTHEGTLPTLPRLGRALERIQIDIPVPHLTFPDDGDEPNDPNDPSKTPDGHGASSFIKDATMHLLSSTAQFTLRSPFTKTTLYMTSINATAFHEGEVLGKIQYNLPMAVPPGLSVTPRLPVEWDINSVGYDILRRALGGRLQVDAVANVSVAIDEWDDSIWYKGKGIGAHVRL